jgi:hypothetical protein
MLVTILKDLFRRDLNKLKTEIEMYADEAKLWRVEKDIANSAGNLCLHLVGNLNTYIGAELGATNYVRNRPLEFSARDVPQSILIQKIEETITVVENSLNNLTDEEIKKEYPLLIFEKKTSTEFLLVHLAMHLSYHLGQINYHRRLLGRD